MAFGDHEAPSTLLGVAVLGYPDQMVEIEAIAAVAAIAAVRDGNLQNRLRLAGGAAER